MPDLRLISRHQWNRGRLAKFIAVYMTAPG
jgi:hypothetical protein